jgi:hypothetical protein
MSDSAASKEKAQQGYYEWLKGKGGDASEWTYEKYASAYESYVPWLEDKYLQYFTSDNKASYATKGMFPRCSQACWQSQSHSSCLPFVPFSRRIGEEGRRKMLSAAKGTQESRADIDASIEQLEQTKVTGVEPVNKMQDGVNNLVGGQLGQGGAGEGVGNMLSKEGVNRTERGGKDESGKII